MQEAYKRGPMSRLVTPQSSAHPSFMASHTGPPSTPTIAFSMSPPPQTSDQQQLPAASSQALGASFFDGPPNAFSARERWRRRLEALFAVRAPTKTPQDIESALTFFSSTPESGGYDEMWRQAMAKYGPEPTPTEVRRAFWRSKLSAYYLLVDPVQTSEDIEECLDYFEKRSGGFEAMWKKVQQKYGVIVDEGLTAARDEERLIGDVVVARDPKTVLSGILSPRVSVMVVLAGVMYRLYQNAPLAAQFQFNSAVASEIKFVCDFPKPLIVVKVAEHVEGLTIEMETECPDGSTSAAPASLLVHYINSGSFPTGLIRKAYLEALQGNPAKVFVMDAAVVESRQTAGYRGTLAIRPGVAIGEGGQALPFQRKLPSIEESRELILARKESVVRPYAFLVQNMAPEAQYQPQQPAPSPSSVDEYTTTSTPPQIVQAGKRVYPPPVSEYMNHAQGARSVRREPTTVGTDESFGEVLGQRTHAAHKQRSGFATPEH